MIRARRPIKSALSPRRHGPCHCCSSPLGRRARALAARHLADPGGQVDLASCADAGSDGARGNDHRRPARERGVLRTALAMRTLGARLDRRAGRWHVNGLGVGGFLEPEQALDFAGSGTGLSLATGLVGSLDFPSRFIGDAALSSSPAAARARAAARDRRPCSRSLRQSAADRLPPAGRLSPDQELPAAGGPRHAGHDERPGRVLSAMVNEFFRGRGP